MPHAALLAASRLPALECALSTELLPTKRDIVRDNTYGEVQDIVARCRELLGARLSGLREQLTELTDLRGKNQNVIEYMMRKVRSEKDEFEQGLQKYYAVRSVFTNLSNNLFGHLGLDALREGKGVCQDFAHLSLILLRGMGIPARYVSGYLHPKRNAKVGDTVDGQSHAWIQAWTGEWWNYDPTNDTEINEQYISVGVGRDYADVTPLKGIYSGEGSTDLDVVVEITRLA